MIKGATYRISRLRYDATVIYQCSQDKRLSWWKRAYCFCTSYYVLGEMDLIPDFIPLIGHLDDVFLMPVFLRFARKIIGEEIYQEHNSKHKIRRIDSNAATYILDVIFTVIWLIVFYVLVIKFIKPLFK